MTEDDIIDMAKEADMYANSEWEHSKNPKQWKQSRDEYFADLVADTEREKWPEEMKAMERQVEILTDALAKERERCIGIIYGQCGSDNVAQRTVDAIRKQS